MCDREIIFKKISPIYFCRAQKEGAFQPGKKISEPESTFYLDACSLLYLLPGFVDGITF